MTEIYKCTICNWTFFLNGPKCVHQSDNRNMTVIADTSDSQRIAELEQQLADMTAERDAAVARCKIVKRAFFVGIKIVIETSGAFSSDEMVQKLVDAAIRGAEKEEQARNGL